MKLKQIRVDGYKNLIDCTLDLGNFNVLVGPNNSGKSNVLEVLPATYSFCFGNEEGRNLAFKGFPFRKYGSSICHLEKYSSKPIKIGISFETIIEKKKWVADYDFHIECNRNENGKFLFEELRAKDATRTGILRKYISRHKDVLSISGKRPRKIALKISALQTVETIYPEYKGVPKELKNLISCVKNISICQVYAISPIGLRKGLTGEEAFGDFRTSSMNIIKNIDNIWKYKDRRNEFKDTICHILDLEDITFVGKDIIIPSEKGEATTKRARFCFIKREGDKPANIMEYSDGTLVVAAILTAFFSDEYKNPLLYCIEELENCIHPATLERLLRFLQDHSDRWPVLITTHSPYLLNGVNPDDVRVAVTNEYGAIHFERVENSKQLSQYLNKSLMSFGELLATDFEGFRKKKSNG